MIENFAKIKASPLKEVSRSLKVSFHNPLEPGHS